MEGVGEIRFQHRPIMEEALSLLSFYIAITISDRVINFRSYLCEGREKETQRLWG